VRKLYVLQRERAADVRNGGGGGNKHTGDLNRYSSPNGKKRKDKNPQESRLRPNIKGKQEIGIFQTASGEMQRKRSNYHKEGKKDRVMWESGRKKSGMNHCNCQTFAMRIIEHRRERPPRLQERGHRVRREGGGERMGRDDRQERGRGRGVGLGGHGCKEGGKGERMTPT